MDTNENRVLDLYPLVSIRGKKSNNQKTQAIEFAEKFTRILCFLCLFVAAVDFSLLRQSVWLRSRS